MLIYHPINKRRQASNTMAIERHPRILFGTHWKPGYTHVQIWAFFPYYPATQKYGCFNYTCGPNEGDTRFGFPAGLRIAGSFEDTLCHAILNPALVQQLDPAAITNRHRRQGLSLKVALLALYQLGQGVPPSPRAPAITPAHIPGLQLIAPVPAPVQATVLQAPAPIAPPVTAPSDQEGTHDDDVDDDEVAVDDDQFVFTDINQFLGSHDGFSGLSEAERRTKMDEFIDQVSFETEIELSEEDVEELNEMSAKNKELFLKFYNLSGLPGIGSQARREAGQ